MAKEILDFCNKYSIGKKIVSVENNIRCDMGLEGDDAFFFLKEYELKFGVKILDEFDFQKYFHTEYELFWGKNTFKKDKIREIEKELKISDLISICPPKGFESSEK